MSDGKSVCNNSNCRLWSFIKKFSIVLSKGGCYFNPESINFIKLIICMTNFQE